MENIDSGKLLILEKEYDFYAKNANNQSIAAENTLKVYVIVIGAFFSFLSFINGKNEIAETNFNQLSIYAWILTLCVLLLLFLKISEHRQLMIAYVRSLNNIRRYFVEKVDNELSDYFTYPANPKNPRFLKLGRYFTWELCIVGFINSIFLFGLVYVSNKNNPNWWIFSFGGLLLIAFLQFGYYYYKGKSNEKQY